MQRNKCKVVGVGCMKYKDVSLCNSTWFMHIHAKVLDEFQYRL